MNKFARLKSVFLGIESESTQKKQKFNSHLLELNVLNIYVLCFMWGSSLFLSQLCWFL